MIISAFNEAHVIEAKVMNTLALDYPTDQLEVIVVSDCSDDATDHIVESIDDHRVKLLRLTQRSGKSLGLNAAVAQANGEILVFTDANAMFEKEALRQMAMHFQEAQVGVVTGAQLYASSADEAPTEEGLYWRYDSAIKSNESNAGSLIGGDGAIMALRKQLFFELAADDLSDFLLPLRICMEGHRNIYEPNARCFEEPADSYNKEFRRKVRIVNRAWRATLKAGGALNVFRYGWFSICLWSHKVLRWWAGAFMLLTIVTNILLWSEALFYQIALIGQMVFYSLALVGLIARDRQLPSLIGVPFYFCSVNYAAILGIFQHYTGERYATWSTPRESHQ